MIAKYALRVGALGYLAIILVLPVGMVFYRTFEHGLAPVWAALTAPQTLHALWLTVLITAIAVPANTAFGIVCALVIVRKRFAGKSLLLALIDLPFAVSPIVVGLSLILLYGRTGWLGDWLTRNDIQVIFALPSMVLATMFVSLSPAPRKLGPPESP